MNQLLEKKSLQHVAGTLLIEARAAFLNGAGLGSGEDRTTTVHKTFRKGQRSVPYVSAQAWRRWLRNTLIEETGWPASEIRAIAWNAQGNTSKVAGHVAPVDYAEDDLFGYMRAAEGQGKRVSEADAVAADDGSDDDAMLDPDAGKIAAVMRASPLATSVLASIRSDGWQGRDDGFVHVQSHDPDALELAEWMRAIEVAQGPSGKQDALKKKREALKKQIKGKATEDALKIVRAFVKEHQMSDRSPMPNPQSPLPYSTRFFNSHLEGIFCLDYARVGVFWNLGDRKELDPHRVDAWMKEGKIELAEDRGPLGKIYRLRDRSVAAERSRRLIQALAVLRGGAKQAAFATDVAPKALILAGLSCGNPIFNRLFTDSEDGPRLNTKRLKEIVADYANRIATPVFVGIREGYLSNPDEVRQLSPSELDVSTSGLRAELARASFVVCTPLQAAAWMAEWLR
jgi:CRISPR-associated autoregulator DevR family